MERKVLATVADNDIYAICLGEPGCPERRRTASNGECARDGSKQVMEGEKRGMRWRGSARCKVAMVPTCCLLVERVEANSQRDGPAV